MDLDAVELPRTRFKDVGDFANGDMEDALFVVQCYAVPAR